MLIMLSAGEASGDLHGAMLAKEIKRLSPDVKLAGLGGAKMKEAGVTLWEDFSHLSVMGVWEVVKNIFAIISLLNRLTDRIKKEKPDLLVIIDYPDFNWRLAKRAKAAGVRVFSYIPPSAWAWRKGRAAACAKIASDLVAIFPHELAPYEAAGANIFFLGNPLVDTVKPTLSPKEAREFFGLKEEEPVVLLLPGSRAQEIDRLLKAELDAAKILKEKRPETRFFLPAAKNIDREFLREKTREFDFPVTVTAAHTYDLMSIADFAVAASGTAVMEAALVSLPCVVVYRMSPLSYAIGKLLVHIENISLPNILLGERVLPELLQDEVTPKNIVKAALPFYKDSLRRAQTVSRLKEAAAKLGESGAASRIAAKILSAAENEKETIIK